MNIRNLYKIAFLLLIFLVSCQKHDKQKLDESLTSLKLDFQEGDLPSLHPHALMIYLRGISISKTLFEGLTRVNSQGKIDLAGAKSFDISSDKLRYTFVLRENKWSDGKPVTAFQYEAAWKEALSPHSSCSRADLLYMIKNASEVKQGKLPLEDLGVKALDEKTLFVELAYPSPYFLELAAQPICAPLVDPKRKEPLEFNGPFVVDIWKKGDYLRLKPNPYFWDEQHISLKQIEIFMIQDMTTAFSLYEKGGIDWIGVPLCPLSTELISHFKKESSLKSHPVDRAFWIFLNTKHPLLSSSHIRQALSLAINRSLITNHILIGGYPLTKPLPNALLSYTPSSTLKEDLVEANLHFEQGLKELGLTKDTLKPLVITFSQQANRKQLAEYLQQAWSQALGIEVNTEATEWNILRSNLEKGLFQISGCFEAAFYKDPMELLGKFMSINPSNFSQWVSPIFQETLSSARQEKNQQKQLEQLAKAEKILINEMPFIPISSDTLLFTHHPKLQGYVFDYVGAIDFSRASFSRGDK